jgi:hypothetical protein
LKNNSQLGYGVISNYKTTLSRSINSSASTVYVSSMTTNDGHTITMSDLGSKVFLTIDPGKTKEEIIMCTGISSLSFTGCARGLAFYGTSTAAVSANQESHNSGATIVMSNVHYVYEELIDKDTNQTISGNISIYGNLTATGTIDFSSGSSVSVPAPTADSHAATKLYADNLAFTGFGTSTLTTAGGGYLSTKAEMSAGSYNSNQPKFLYSGLATSTGQVATSSIVVTEADGDINSNMIGQDQNYSWSGTNSFSGTNTFTATTTLATTTINGSINLPNFSSGFSRILMATTTAVNITGVNLALFSTTTIPAYSLGNSGVMKLRLNFSAMAGNSVFITLRAYLGGNLVASSTMTTATGDVVGSVDLIIINNGYSSQNSYMSGAMIKKNVIGTSNEAGNFFDTRTTATNTAVDNNFIIYGTSTGGAQANVYSSFIEVTNFTK